MAISDYGKGLLSPQILKELFRLGTALKIPVITDPKGVDFSKYQGTTIIKPNLSEAYAAAGLEAHHPLESAAKKILDTTQAETVIITRSESGISVFNKQQQRSDFPVRMHEIRDVTGAGDTVLAMLAYAIGNRLEMHTAAELCNIAAGLAIERMGCAQIQLSELIERLMQIDASNKLFSEADFYILGEFLKQKRDRLLLRISSAHGMTSAIFSAIHQLASRNADLVLAVQENEPDPDFLQLLAAIKDVKFIVVENGPPEKLEEMLSPKQVFSLKAQGDIRSAEQKPAPLS